MASYTDTTAIGETDGVTGTCGSQMGNNGMIGNWTCGVDVKPKCTRTYGHCDAADANLGFVNFELQSPQ